MKTKILPIFVLLFGLMLSACHNDIPSVLTLGAEMIAHETECEIAVEGKITSDGGDPVIAYGFCLSEHANPTVNDTKKEVKGSASGIFSTTFSNLGCQTYYVCAYATNLEGTAYGEIIEITTSYKIMPKILEIKSDSVDLEEATIFSCVNPQGKKTDVYVSWGSNINNLNQEIHLGTYQDDQKVDLSYKLTQLKTMTHYYYRFKAVNENGSVSSEVASFETYAVKDGDGNRYRAVRIGSQIWITENLKTTRFLNGDPIPEVKDQDEWNKMKTPARCYYDNDPTNGEIYGSLYNWYVASDPRGLIEGWHVPTDQEIIIMSEHLGGQEVAGGKMKTASALWQQPNVGATNESGFSALPGGARNEEFGNMSLSAVFWNSNPFPVGGVGESFIINNNRSILFYGGSFMFKGFSLRLIQN